MPGFWNAVAADSLTAERAAGSGLVPNGTPFPAESGKAGAGLAHPHQRTASGQGAAQPGDSECTHKHTLAFSFLNISHRSSLPQHHAGHREAQFLLVTAES